MWNDKESFIFDTDRDGNHTESQLLHTVAKTMKKMEHTGEVVYGRQLTTWL